MKNWRHARELRFKDDDRTQELIDKMDVFLQEMQTVADRLIVKLSDLDKKD